MSELREDLLSLSRLCWRSSSACAGSEKAEVGQRQQQQSLWLERSAGAGAESDKESFISQWKWNSLSTVQFNKPQSPVRSDLISKIQFPYPDWLSRYYVFSQTIPVTANPDSLTWRESAGLIMSKSHGLFQILILLFRMSVVLFSLT